MSLLKEVNEWVNKGFFIEYFIVNQIENGYEQEVLKGHMPKITYTFTINKEAKELFSLSVDTIEEGFNESLDFLKRMSEEEIISNT